MIKNIALFLIFSCIFLIVGVSADSNETIKILTPEDSQMHGGITDVRWYTKGEGLNSSRIFISSGVCDESKVYFGDIRVISGDFSTDINTFSYDWDTTSPLLNALTLQDGDYCLTANAVYGLDGTRSVEDSINIKINNNQNRTPRILNSVSTVFLSPQESLTLDIDASDLDGDKLVYSLLKTPQFLTINKDNGLISTVSSLEPGIHSVVVRVDDQNGAINDHAFILNVVESAESFEGNLNFSFVNESRILSKKLLLEWSWQDNPFDLSLQYSTDGIVWNDIDDVSADTTQYNWNAQSVLTGKYYIRFIARDNLATIYAQLLPEIFLADLGDAGNSNTTPSFHSLSPGEGDSVDTSITNISGEFILPVGRTLSKFELTVNETIVVNNCVVENLNFNCTLSTALQDGANKYLVKIIDSSAAEAVLEVNFIVGNSVIPTDTPVETTSNNFIFLLCILAILIGIAIFTFMKFKDVITKKLGSLKRSRPKKNKDEEIDPIININNTTVTDNATTKDDSDYDPFSISTNEVGTTPKDSSEKDFVREDESKKDELISDENVLTGKDVDVALPSSYGATDEELPDWLKDIDDASDPVGIEPEELEGNKPIEGAQPFGMDNSRDRD